MGISHFFKKNGTYVYKEGGFSNEDPYQNKNMVGFVNNLVYLRGEVPLGEADRKHLKHMIGVPLLIGSCSHMDRRIALGKFETSLVILILTSLFWCWYG